MSGLLTWPRLAYRLQRFELVTLMAGTLAFGATALLVANRLDALRAANPNCFAPALVNAPVCDGTAGQWEFWATIAAYVLRAAWALPFVVGLILGVPIVAREVEQRTGAIVWSLGTSRRRWLMHRTWPVLALAVAALAVVALTSQVVSAAALPDRHLAADFTWYDRRGPLLLVRGVLAFGIGLLAGVVLGRVLPALVAGVVLTLLVMGGIAGSTQAWRATDTAVTLSSTDAAAGIVLGRHIQTADGRRLSLADAEAQHVIPRNLVPNQASPPPNFTFGQEVIDYVPGDHLSTWLARESALTAVVALLIGVGAMVLLARRRPLA